MISTWQSPEAVSDAYAKVAAEGIQIHGGQGFTWEQDLHLYYKRAKASGCCRRVPSTKTPARDDPRSARSPAR